MLSVRSLEVFSVPVSFNWLRSSGSRRRRGSGSLWDFLPTGGTAHLSKHTDDLCGSDTEAAGCLEKC
eukprot:121665-Heterocapsa_arctica.AAC.1